MNKFTGPKKSISKEEFTAVFDHEYFYFLDKHGNVKFASVEILKIALLEEYRLALAVRDNNALELKTALIGLLPSGSKDISRDIEVFLEYFESGFNPDIDPPITIKPETVALIDREKAANT